MHAVTEAPYPSSSHKKRRRRGGGGGGGDVQVVGGGGRKIKRKAKEKREKMSGQNRQVPLPSSSSDGEGEGPPHAHPRVPDDPPATWSAGGRNNVNGKKRLSKQLSMRETTREAAWEKRRQQILLRQRRRLLHESEEQVHLDEEGGELEEEQEQEEEEEEEEVVVLGRGKSLTDEDLDELRGSIELGFGFSEEGGGHDLCHTLPALDLYFAVNRQLSDPRLRFSSPSPVSSPSTTRGGSSSSLLDTPSPRSPTHLNAAAAAAAAAAAESPSWKICSPGDNPQHVKTRLRHWAQAVACSVLLKEWNGGSGAPTAGKE